jgi:hypothetical protein
MITAVEWGSKIMHWLIVEVVIVVVAPLIVVVIVVVVAPLVVVSILCPILRSF